MSDKYMKNLTFANIAKACEGTYIGDETLLDTTITGAVIDSRQVKEGYLFIPIKGERVDGHKFIPTVFEQGAAIVLSEHELTDSAGLRHTFSFHTVIKYFRTGFRTVYARKAERMRTVYLISLTGLKITAAGLRCNVYNYRIFLQNHD